MRTFTLHELQPVNIGSRRDAWVFLPPGTVLEVSEHEVEPDGGEPSEVIYIGIDPDEWVHVVVSPVGVTSHFPLDCGTLSEGTPDDLSAMEVLTAREAAERYPQFAYLYADTSTEVEQDLRDLHDQDRDHVLRLIEQHGSLSPEVYRYFKAVPTAAAWMELAQISGLYDDPALAQAALEATNADGDYGLGVVAREQVDDAVARGRLARTVVAQVIAEPGRLQVDVARSMGTTSKEISSLAYTLGTSGLLVRSHRGNRVVLDPGQRVDELGLEDAASSDLGEVVALASGPPLDVWGFKPVDPTLDVWQQRRQALARYHALHHAPFSPHARELAFQLVDVTERAMRAEPARFGSTANLARIDLVMTQAAFWGEESLQRRIEVLAVLADDDRQDTGYFLRYGRAARQMTEAVRAAPGTMQAELARTYPLDDLVGRGPWKRTGQDLIKELIESEILRREKHGGRVRLWVTDDAPTS